MIFHTASYQLLNKGYRVTTFTDHRFGGWLKEFIFAKQPNLDQIEETFSDYDAIFLQHDNSPKARAIHALNKPVYTFYGSHVLPKHGPLRLGRDYVCDPNQSMVENVLLSLKSLFRLTQISSEMGFKPLPGLIHRRKTNQVLIHTRSSKEEKMWPKSKFQKVAQWLKSIHLEPLFLPDYPTLEDLASAIYETGYFIGNDSGPGHIASALKIPHLIIGKEEREMRLWRPGWLPGRIITPSQWIPDWRLLRPYWKRFISTNKVIHNFNKILRSS